MNWVEIIGIVVGSTAFSTLISALVKRPETYADRLEKRVNTLAEKIDLYEMREMIEASAISCAHKCHIPDEECPVLNYMDKHPIPKIGQFVESHMDR